MKLDDPWWLRAALVLSILTAGLLYLMLTDHPLLAFAWWSAMAAGAGASLWLHLDRLDHKPRDWAGATIGGLVSGVFWAAVWALLLYR